MVLKVIVDANFLFVPIQFKMDIFECMSKLLNRRFQPVLLSTTHHELLTMMKKGSPKLRKQAEMALKFAEKCRLVHVRKTKEEANDDIILRVATRWQSPVATNDSELRRKLRQRNISVVFLRGKNRLEVEGTLHEVLPKA